MATNSTRAENRDQVRDMRADNYFRIKNTIIDHDLFRIGLAGFAVYGVLCRFADNRSQRCFPSQKTIADIINCSPTTVRKGLALLQKEKLISVAQKGKLGRRFNIYTLLETAKTKGVTRSKSDASESDHARSKSDHARSESDHELNELTRRKKLNEKKQGITSVMRTDSHFSEVLSPEDYEWAVALLDAVGIQWRDEPQRDGGAIRAAWALTRGTDTQRREQFQEAVEEAANFSTAACSVFGLMLKSLRDGNVRGVA
jgi:helix-turn-helix protein